MIVVGIENDEIALFAYFDASNPVGSLKGGSSVQGQGGDGFFNTHLHIDAGQSNGQRDRTGETTARVQVGSKCYRTAGQSFHDRVRRVLSEQKAVKR